MALRVRLIVPRRSDGGHRDRIWEFCKRSWTEQRPDWKIAEGKHENGPFNRSAAINRAARGRWDVAVILDADTVVDVVSIEKAIARAHETGRLVLPFHMRCMVSKRGTEEILRGRRGSWERLIQARQVPSDAYEYISGCQVVPRELWDAIGGFDERFEGWGGEDDAFHAASIALSGHDARTDRLRGKAWHLWHERSPDADTRTATWRQAKALSDRYIGAAWDRERMLSLLAEKRTSDQIVLTVLTCANRDTLEPTIRSAEENLKGPIGRKLICVDAGEGEPGVNVDFDGWDVVHMGSSQGYVRATRNAQFHAIASGQPWVFWLEDDFTFNQPIDLLGMQKILDDHPELAQLSLKRQPWYPEEIEVGDMLAWRPRGTFKQRDGYVEHRAYWTTNAMMVRRSFLASHEWPGQPGSERRFGQMIFRQPGVFGGILGAIDDPPLTHHIGHQRAGFGY